MRDAVLLGLNSPVDDSYAVGARGIIDVGAVEGQLQVSALSVSFACAQPCSCHKEAQLKSAVALFTSFAKLAAYSETYACCCCVCAAV